MLIMSGERRHEESTAEKERGGSERERERRANLLAPEISIVKSDRNGAMCTFHFKIITIMETLTNDALVLTLPFVVSGIIALIKIFNC